MTLEQSAKRGAPFDALIICFTLTLCAFFCQDKVSHLMLPANFVELNSKATLGIT